MGIGDMERAWLKEQFGEKPIACFEKAVGRFLEVGAYDGHTDSLTTPLVELGWSGVMVEPHPANFLKLKEYLKDKPWIQAVNAAVSPCGGLMEFWDDGGSEESTLDTGHRDRTKYGKGFHYEPKPFYVNTVTMAEIFRVFGIEWTFILIDIEGMDLAVLSTMPLRELHGAGLQALCVEYSFGTPEEFGEFETVLGRWFKTEFINPPNLFVVRK